MSCPKEKKESNLLLKLFGIPAIFLNILLFMAMFPDDESESLALGDAILGDICILSIWFVISFIIVKLVEKIKKIKHKKENMIKDDYIKDEKTTVKSESKKSVDKCLFTYKCTINEDEYKEMSKYFPSLYWSYIKWATILNIFFSLIISSFMETVIAFFVFFIIYQAILMVYYKVKIGFFMKKTFRTFQSNGKNSFNIHFYENYFINELESSYKVNYSDIDKCVETNTNFYIKTKNNNITIIQKNKCETELINFIRDNLNNLEKHFSDKYKNPQFIKNGMIILFILNIASIWGALFSMEIMQQIDPQHGYNFIKHTWVFWCWLPIPLLSIIFGFKLKKDGFKCTKNIVGGFIIGFLLLLYGSFWKIETFSQDYKNMDPYRNIIDANLPSNGELEIQNWGTFFDEDKTEYMIINAYYDKEDTTELINSIENSNNWILSTDIKSNLKIFIPSTILSDNDAYFSIYNKTTDQYNKIPETSGKYEIYTMKYDKSKKQLEIHRFYYFYK